MGFLIVAGIIGIVVFVCYICMFEEYRYRSKYPLDTPVKVEINREELNDNFSRLSSVENEILRYTKNNEVNAFITREVQNKLVLTIKNNEDESKEWVLYGGGDRWIQYMQKGYFVKQPIWIAILEELSLE